MRQLRLIVTRPVAQAQPWVNTLADAGWQVHALPLIDIEPLADGAALTEAWQQLDQVKLAMFVSANAVEHFFAMRPDALNWPTSTWAGSPGPGTSAALLAAGVPARQLIEPAADAAQWDSEALWLQLQRRLPDWQGHKAWVVRGEDGRDWLADQLRECGAEVQFLAAYRRVVPAFGPAQHALIQAALARPQEHLWLFSSSEAVTNLAAGWPGPQWGRSRALASHPRIAQTATELGFGRVELVRGGPQEVSDWLLGMSAH